MLLEHKIYLTNKVSIHKRKIYDIVQLLGDLGGVTEVFLITMGFFLFPISETSFDMKSTKRMFLAHTKHKDVFIED